MKTITKDYKVKGIHLEYQNHSCDITCSHNSGYTMNLQQALASTNINADISILESWINGLVEQLKLTNK